VVNHTEGNNQGSESSEKGYLLPDTRPVMGPGACGCIGLGDTPRRLQPNPYEDSLCQETDSPSERFFAFFSAFQGRAQSTVGRMS